MTRYFGRTVGLVSEITKHKPRKPNKCFLKGVDVVISLNFTVLQDQHDKS